MSLTIMSILLFSIVLLVTDYKNKYHLFFILMMLGMALPMATVIAEIARSSNYILPPDYVLGGLESIIYTRINKVLHIPLSTLLIIRNCGIVTYLIANIFFVISFSNSIHGGEEGGLTKQKVGRYILLSAFPLLYFILYHPRTAYWIYVVGQTLDTDAHRNSWFTLFKVADVLVMILGILYLAYPIIYLISNFLKNRITFFAEQLLGLSVSLALLNGTFFYMFFIGIFRLSAQAVSRYGLWRYMFLDRIPVFYIAYMPFVMLLILATVLFIIIRFKTIDLINSFKARTIRRNLNSLYLNQRDILHSNKNLMFRIKLLSEEALEHYGTDLGRERLETVRDLCDSNMNVISKTLDYIRALTIHTISNDFIRAIENALTEAAIPEDITVIRDYQLPEIYFDFDMYHITQSIANLLNNSVDAIRNRVSQRREIRITVYASNNWVYCSIADTGCGIPGKLLKKIFTPYTSTKSKQHNWGLGLSYVFRIIKAHYGYIRFKSKPGTDTVAEILLPRGRPTRRNRHVIRE